MLKFKDLLVVSAFVAGCCFAGKTACSDNTCNDGGDTGATCVLIGLGGYSCNCTGDYVLSTSEKECLDYCVDNPCDNEGDIGARCALNAAGDNYECMCTDGSTTDGTICTNDCSGNTCKDGGDVGATCADDSPGDEAYSCNCTGDYILSTLKEECLGFCVDNPCDDDWDTTATCSLNDAEKNYTCACTDGSTTDGIPCSKNECWGNTCNTGGDAGATCYGGSPFGWSYICSCTEDYLLSIQGTECLGFCVGNPCDDNGDTKATCSLNDAGDNYTCTCTDGIPTDGTACLIPDCSRHTCKDDGDIGATCVDGVANDSKYSCNCTVGYTVSDSGTKCLINDCANNLCQELGDVEATCTDETPGDGEHVCVCTSEFYESDSKCLPIESQTTEGG